VGYTVLALTQTARSKVEPRTFVNALDPLLAQLRTRPGIVLLTRLTIVLDADSEKGFGLVRDISHSRYMRCFSFAAFFPRESTRSNPRMLGR
jgi:hypothetical protein